MCVVPCLRARRTSAPRALRRPSRVRASDARARSGARSAMPTTWMPGVCFACARYIDAELAGADEADGERAAFGGALLQHAVQVHRVIPVRGRARARAAALGAAPARPASRTPSTPATRRATMPERGRGFDVERVVVDEQHALRGRSPAPDHVREVVGVGLQHADLVRREIGVEVGGERPLARESLPVQLVGVRHAGETVARRELGEQLGRARVERARPGLERGEERGRRHRQLELAR